VYVQQGEATAMQMAAEDGSGLGEPIASESLRR
jgi:hypothetical protein